MNQAIRNGHAWSKDNTCITYDPTNNMSAEVYLHGHQIATLDHSTNALKIDSCGYQTVTTKSRLNAILQEVKGGCRVFQKQWDWFVSYNNQTQSFWDGMILLDTDSLEVA